MMVISKTPYRLSLFGGGTDYPAWFENNPTKIVSAAMAQYCYITVRDVPPFFDYSTVITYSEIEKVNSLNVIKHPSARECLRYMGIDKGVSVVYEGDLPARSGIGSSSSFTVGLLNALYTFKNRPLSKDGLAKEAIYIEQNILRENVGIQDQIMAAHGGVRIIDCSKGKDWTTTEFKLSADYTKELESHIMLGFSGVSRYSEIQSKKKVANIKEGKSTSELEAMAALSNIAIDYMIEERDMASIGQLLSYGWRLKRQLAEGVSEEWIDDIYDASIKYGSLGGKLMGAGGGGFFFFLVPPEKQEKFKEQMSSIKVWVPFKFDTEGSQIIHSS
jgi:D-glycero-alpha-D-manno-heptose-7-phosphate kinase